MTGVSTSRRLPIEPLIVIEPSKTWRALNVRELWAHRELLYFMVWRDVKVRYKQTFLGVAWAVLQPLFMMLVFTIFFGRLAGVATDGIPYPLFAYAGLVPWTFFSNGVLNSSNSLVGSAGLVTKVYFPRPIVPIAAVFASLVDFALAFVLLLPLIAYYRWPISRGILMIPLLVALIAMFTLAVGLWLSALNVKYRDIRFALPFIIQLWLFLSSVIVPSSTVPPRFQWLLLLNPMSAFIEAHRAALLGFPFNWTALLLASGLTVAAFVYAAYSFRRVEKHFADII